MNRLNEYFENLDKKNIIMLYVSIIILFVTIGYYIYQNYFLPQKEDLEGKRISLIKKFEKIRSNNDTIVMLRRNCKKEALKINSLKEDLKYLKELVYSTPKIDITKRKYLNIINEYLKKGSNLNASFEFNNTDKLNKYNMYISGNFLPDEYFMFVEFLKTLQRPKAIITINRLDIKYKNYVNYEINLSIWSLK